MAAWEQYINAHGGINGHPVQYINKDEAFDSSRGQAAAQSLVQSHVVAIMDQSSIDGTWASIPQAAHVPVISLNQSAGVGTYESNPDFFGNGTTVNGILYGHVAIAKAIGGTVFGGIYCSELAQCAQAVKTWQTDATLIPGIKFGLALAASNTAPDYTAQCLAMQQAGVNVLFPIPPANTVADSCARQGYHPHYIGSQQTLALTYASDPNLQGAVQNQEGFPWMLSKTPAQKEFQAAEGKVWPHAIVPSTISAGWTGLKLLQAALTHVKRNSPVTAQDTLDGLYALHDATLGGLSPTPLSFTAGKPTTERCYFVVQIKNKKWAAFNGGKPECEPRALYATS